MTVEVRRRLREVLAESGGTVGSGRLSGSAGPPLAKPFGDAVSVEGEVVSAVPVRRGTGRLVDAGFADGIQRFVVEGWVGMTPILRAYVGAAVLWREDRVLNPAHHAAEEFIVAPLERLADATVAGLHATGLPVRDCGVAEREHPVLDVQLALREVERRREGLEGAVVQTFRSEHPDAWVVVDGSLRQLSRAVRRSRSIGVIKSHETQYFAGADLQTALTLAEGHRTTVFRRVGSGEHTLYSWYLRLWDWTGQDILYGLIRVEQEEGADVLDEVDQVCGWLMDERSPIAAPDSRWDRLLYPIREVENYLRAKAGSWW